MSGALEVDPAYLSSLIGQEVEAESCSGSRFRGRCLSVDPVSGSLVLVSEEKLQLLPWIDVVKVQIIQESDDQKDDPDLETFNFLKNLLDLNDQLLTRPDKQLSGESLESRKLSLESWLTRNLLSVKVVGQRIVVQNGLVTIDPPYRPIDCKATNEIILQRVSNLVARHEEDKDPV